FTRAWLAAAELWPQTLDRVQQLAPARARVHTGEQSNTSIRVDGRLGGAMLKVFRVLDAGPNPDVQVPSALRDSGWQHVPAVLGTLAGSWPHPESGEQVRGDLGVLTALVPRARDGFELACDYARLGRDFAPLATWLGECMGQMHARLRAEFCTQAQDGAGHLASEGAVVSGLGAQLQQRCRWALEQVPALQAWSQRITATIEAAGQAGTAQADGARASEVQRIHGDLHLGQLLHSDEGW